MASAGHECFHKTEIEVNPQRYTESQVLFGIREVWPCLTGTSDSFDADTRIHTFMEADDSRDELDVDFVVQGIERFFGFKCSHKEWADFFGSDVARRSLEEWEQTVAPNLTFGSLARFIADRAPVLASFDPISVFGRRCAPAGVFTGIQCVANITVGNRLRFAPSTRIIDVMQGHDLDRFWTQLRWMTEHATPKLPAFWRGVTGMTGCLGVLAVIAASIATSETFWIISTLLAAVVSYLTAAVYKRFANPLPAHIVTFRDLSTLIAAHRW